VHGVRDHPCSGQATRNRETTGFPPKGADQACARARSATPQTCPSLRSCAAGWVARGGWTAGCLSATAGKALRALRAMAARATFCCAGESAFSSVHSGARESAMPVGWRDCLEFRSFNACWRDHGFSPIGADPAGTAGPQCAPSTPPTSRHDGRCPRNLDCKYHPP